MAKARKRVLLVEDHRETCHMLAALLNRWGIEVITTHSQQSALEVIDTRFDAIIADIALPDGTGYAVIREAKSRHTNLLGIAISGYGSEADVQIGKLAGFDYHLTKPLDSDELRSLLKVPQRDPDHGRPDRSTSSDRPT